MKEFIYKHLCKLKTHLFYSELELFLLSVSTFLYLLFFTLFNPESVTELSAILKKKLLKPIHIWLKKSLEKILLSNTGKKEKLLFWPKTIGNWETKLLFWMLFMLSEKMKNTIKMLITFSLMTILSPKKTLFCQENENEHKKNKISFLKILILYYISFFFFFYILNTYINCSF
jgi:hypothetical protein